MSENLLKIGYVWNHYPEITECGLKRLHNADEELCKKPGVSMEMWETFATHIGFRYRLVQVPDWGPLMAMIANGSLDGSAAFMFLKPERYTHISFTYPSLLYEGGFAGRSSATLEPEIRLYVFSKEAMFYIALFLTMLLAICVVTTGNLYRGSYEWFRFVAYQGTTNITSFKNPLIVIGMLCLLLTYNGGFQSQRLSSRRHPPPFVDFKSAREQLTSGKVQAYVFDPITTTHYLRYRLYQDEDAWRRHPAITILNPDQMLRTICRDRRNVLFADLGVLGEIWTAHKEYCLLESFNSIPEITNRLHRYEGFGLRKDQPHYNAINNVVLYLYSAGQMEKFLLSKYVKKYYPLTKQNSLPAETPIKLEVLKPVFGVLFVGLLVAFVVFLVEISYEIRRC